MGMSAAIFHLDFLARQVQHPVQELLDAGNLRERGGIGRLPDREPGKATVQSACRSNVYPMDLLRPGRPL